MKGFNSRILIVDLSSGKMEVKNLDDEYLELYPGGLSLGVKTLYEMMPAGAKWDSPESIIGFLPGTLNGSGGFMTCRYTVVSKSPVTNGINDANAGGTFGTNLKKVGFDGVFFKGISDKPVYLLIKDGKPELKSAEKYWDKMTTLEFEKAVSEDLNAEEGNPTPARKYSVSSCGMAGERMAHIAAVMNDGHRAAARGGPGAVMGSKRLKAIVVSGGTAPEIYSKDQIIEINKKLVGWQKEGPVKQTVYAFSNWGTGIAYDSSAMTGDLGIKNWHGTYMDIAQETLTNLSPIEMDKTMKRKKYSCYQCPVGCGAVYEIHEKELDTDEAGRPEYETSGSFGSNLLNGDVYSVNYCNNMCNEYGVDTISAGSTIAWAMNCFEKGLLTKEDLDGIELSWGNSEAICAMIKKICLVEGVGKVLANGSVFAINHFGCGEEFRADAGGIEIPQHDPRFAPPLARTYKFDPTPGRHVQGGLGTPVGNREPEYKNNPEAFKDDDVACTKEAEFRIMSGVCEFSGFGYIPGTLLELFNAATGLKFNEDEMMKCGHRTFLLRQGFNLREGMSRKDAFISGRLVGNPPADEGPHKGVTLDVETMGDNFYAGMGCNPEGIPYIDTLSSIGGLECLIKDGLFAN